MGAFLKGVRLDWPVVSCPARQMRLKVDVRCLGPDCGGERGERHAGDHEWCEVLLAQHVPQGAYIDVDQVKVKANLELPLLVGFDCV